MVTAVPVVQAERWAPEKALCVKRNEKLLRPGCLDVLCGFPKCFQVFASNCFSSFKT